VNHIQPYLKAILGALVAGLGSLYQALDNGQVSAQEWVAVAIATLAAAGAVYAAPWKPAPWVPAESHTEHGQATTQVVLVAAITAVAVVLLLFYLR
jgi:hypothetical protein